MRGGLKTGKNEVETIASRRKRESSLGQTEVFDNQSFSFGSPALPFCQELNTGHDKQGRGAGEAFKRVWCGCVSACFAHPLKLLGKWVGTS